MDDGVIVEMTDPSEAQSRLEEQQRRGMEFRFGLAKLYEIVPICLPMIEAFLKTLSEHTNGFLCLLTMTISAMPRIPNISETNLPIR